MHELTVTLSAWLSQNPAWIFAAIALVAFLESFLVVGVIVPGAILLFTIAALAGGLDMAPMPLLLAAALGASTGDIISFFIGRELEHLLHNRPSMQRWQHQLDAAHRFFEKWGVLGVVAGRFVGPARAFLPAVAGAAGMGRRVFIVTDVVSALAWAPAYVLPGYFSGAVFG